MKKLYSIVEAFVISLFSTYLMYSNGIMNKLFDFFEISNENEKKLIVGAVSVASMAIVTMLIPWCIHSFLRKIKIKVYYIQKDTVKTNLSFKKKAKKVPLCEKELISVQMLITDGCPLFFKIARKLGAKLHITYDPNLFETESKNGWDGSEDSMVERNIHGVITLDLLREITSLENDQYSYKYDYYISPRSTHVSKSIMKLQVLSNNFFLSVFLKIFVKVDENRLILECEV